MNLWYSIVDLLPFEWAQPGSMFFMKMCIRDRLLPVCLAVEGIVCSIIGSFFVKTKENADQKSLLKSLRTGTYLAALLSALVAAPLTYTIVGNWGVYVAILAGLIGGCAIGYFTEYYTSDTLSLIHI